MPASCPKLLLVRADGEPLALLFDAIEGTRELVIKPLGPLLAGHPVISGTSLSVTGEVIFVLNPSGLLRWLVGWPSDGGPGRERRGRDASEHRSWSSTTRSASGGWSPASSGCSGSRSRRSPTASKALGRLVRTGPTAWS